jgi:hypothetical protein
MNLNRITLSPLIDDKETGHLKGGFSKINKSQMRIINGGDDNVLCTNTGDCTKGTNSDGCTNEGMCLHTNN